MKAAIYQNFQSTISIESVRDPVPHSHGAVIEVKASGLCLSDWHGWMGHDKDISLPHVPGHEFSGIVNMVGADVKNWKPGQRVTVPFVCACGSCPVCNSGNQQVCPNQTQAGFTHWGSFAQFVSIDHADVNLVELPEEIEFITAASLGCRFATAFRGVVDQGKAGVGDWVVVHGCGGVGLSAIMIAKAIDSRVIAIDINKDALAFAKDLGAEFCIDANQTNSLVEDVLNITKGGAQLSIDALGNPDIVYQSVSCLRQRGKHIQIGILDPAKKKYANTYG